MTDSLIDTSSSYLEENTILINFIMIHPAVFTTLKYKLYHQTQHFDAIQQRTTRFGSSEPTSGTFCLQKFMDISTLATYKSTCFFNFCKKKKKKKKIFFFFFFIIT